MGASLVRSGRSLFFIYIEWVTPTTLRNIILMSLLVPKRTNRRRWTPQTNAPLIEWF